MGRYRRKKMHVNIKTLKKKYRTKRRTKDMDQIQEDMMPVNHLKLTTQKIDLDLPGAGQHYCLHCARYMMDAESLKKHFTTKPHKRRMKALQEPVYTQREADMAAGMGHFQLAAPPLVAPVKPKLKRVRKAKRSKAMDTRAPEELVMKLTGMGIDSNPVQESKKQEDTEREGVNMEGIDMIFENLKVS